MKTTVHAKKRMRKRCGLSKKSTDRIAAKALKEGVKHNETKGNLHKWVTSVYFKNTAINNIRLYAGYAYLFTDENLVTILSIPQNLMRDFQNLTKRKEPNP